MNRIPVIDAHLRSAAARPGERLADRLWRHGYDLCAFVGLATVLFVLAALAVEVTW